MTRDEAIKVLNDDGWFGTPECGAKWVDLFAALGMLKLDEPKSAHQRMVEACRALDLSGKTIDLVATALDNCGLMVVEK